MKKLTLTGLVVLCVFMSACTVLDKAKETIGVFTETEEYQTTKQYVNSGVQYIGDKTNEFIETNEHAQRAVEKTNEAIDKAKEEAIRIGTGVQEEVRRQYENLKEEAKASVKDSVNKKIDDAFDRI